MKTWMIVIFSGVLSSGLFYMVTRPDISTSISAVEPEVEPILEDEPVFEIPTTVYAVKTKVDPIRADRPTLSPAKISIVEKKVDPIHKVKPKVIPPVVVTGRHWLKFSNEERMAYSMKLADDVPDELASKKTLAILFNRFIFSYYFADGDLDMPAKLIALTVLQKAFPDVYRTQWKEGFHQWQE